MFLGMWGLGRADNRIVGEWAEHVEGGAEELYRNVWAYGWVEGVGSLQESICFSLFEWGKEKRKGGKLDKGDRVVPPGPWAEFWCLSRDIIFTGELCFVQSLSCVRLFPTPWTATHQASLSFTISRSLLKLMSIESVMVSNHPILCHPLLFRPSVFPSIRVFSSVSAIHINTKSWVLVPVPRKYFMQRWPQ